ncbi:MAG: hypothetical protein ACAF41_32340 [Leptolyngbya sp. BL-A-14]
MLQKSTIAAVTLLLTGLCITSMATVALPTPDSDAQFRKLARRALNYGSGEAQLLPGQLPKPLPLDLPLPSQTQVIGSIVRTKEARSYQIYLDVPATPEQVQAFYQQRLQAIGWLKQKFPRALNGGFTSSAFRLPVLFCKSPTGPSIQLTVTAVADAPTDVRLTFSSDADNTCKSIERLTEERLADYNSPLPELLPAPQTEVNFLSGGSGNMVYNSTARLNTKLSSQALVQHYEKQLEQAGWTQQSKQQNGEHFWSLWKWKDNKGKSWQANLTLIKAENKPNQYFASIVAFEP